MRPEGVRRALASRDFRLFCAGHLASVSGNWAHGVAQAWLLYRLTGSPWVLGLASFASQVPVLFLAPVGGWVTDRHGAREVVTRGVSLIALLTALQGILALGGVLRVAHVFAIAFLVGVTNAFEMPARQALVAEVVSRGQLAAAIAVHSSISNAARTLGPALAGAVVAVAGEGWCFLGNAAGSLVMLAALGAMEGRARASSVAAATGVEGALEGFRFAHGARPVRALLVVLAVLGLVGLPYVVVLPVHADRALAVGPERFGALMACSGAGALGGALVLILRARVHGLGLYFGASVAAFGSLLVLLGTTRSFAFAAVLIFAVGVSLTIALGSANTLIQAMVPDALRARVMALSTMLLVGLTPIGSLVAGGLASGLGCATVLVSGGAACAVAGLVFLAWRPSLRAHARELIATSSVGAR